MIDLIFGVDDPMLFHRINLQQFPHHYSCLRYAGVSTICHVQQFGAGVYFNVDVPLQGEVSDLPMTKGVRGKGRIRLMVMDTRLILVIGDQIRSYSESRFGRRSDGMENFVY